MLVCAKRAKNLGGKRRTEEQGISGYMQHHKRIKEWRKAWADVCNKHLEMRGFSARIDHRTLEAQGVNREPKKYVGLGYKHKKSLELTERLRGEGKPLLTNQEIRKIERQIAQLEIAKKDLLITQKKIEDLKQKRMNTRVKDQEEIDRQILHLEEYAMRYVAEIECKIEQFNRDSFKAVITQSQQTTDSERTKKPDKQSRPSRERPARGCENSLNLTHER